MISNLQPAMYARKTAGRRGVGWGEFMARDSKGHQPRTNRPPRTNILEIFMAIFWRKYLTSIFGKLFSEVSRISRFCKAKPSLHFFRNLLRLLLLLLIMFLLQEPLNPAFSPHCQWSPSLYLQWICKRISVAALYLYF